MRKISYIPLFIVGLILLFEIPKLYADDARARYDEAVRLIKEKQADFALMEFRGIMEDFPKSKYGQKAIFAIGEYCYDNKIYYDAVKNFREYITDYPDSEGIIFAKAYLLKIIEDIKEPTREEKKMFENIKRDFFAKPLFLLFSEYKEAYYKSPFQNEFKIRYYLDKIEIYRNGEPFIKITQ